MEDLNAIARTNMSQYQTGGSHSFGLVQSPRSDAAPYSGTDKTHLGPRLITPDHYQQTQTRVTSGQTHYDTIPHSEVQLSPRSRAIRQVDFQMSSGLRAEVQVAAGQVNTHQTVQPQQVSAGLHNETLRWDSCDDRVEPVSPRSRAILEHGQNIQSAYRPNNDTRDYNTPVSPRGVRVVHSQGQGEDINRSYGGINGGKITSRKGAPSNVVRSDGGAYHYVDRKDQRDVTYTRASDIMPHNVAGANQVITSTTHTTTREVNRSQHHVDDLIHQGGDGAEHLPTDQCLSPRSRAVMDHGQTIESAVRPNNDDREHNTPLSPRGVRVVHPTVGGGHEFGEAGGGHGAFSQRMANGDYGSNVVRTDGGAYKYVDKADDHEYYLELLGGAPAVTGETRDAYGGEHPAQTQMPHDITSPGSPTSRKMGYAATYPAGYVPQHELDRIAQLQAAEERERLGPAVQAVQRDRVGNPVQSTDDLLRGGFDNDSIQWGAAGGIDEALSPNSRANIARQMQAQLVHESQWNGLTKQNANSMTGGSDLQQTEYHKWLAAGGGSSPRSRVCPQGVTGASAAHINGVARSNSLSPTSKQVQKLEVQLKAGEFKSPPPTYTGHYTAADEFNYDTAMAAQMAGNPLSPRSGSLLRVKAAYESGAPLSPRSQQLVDATNGFTRFDTLRDMNWGNDFHTNRQISTTTHRDYKPHMQTFNYLAAKQAQDGGAPMSPRSRQIVQVTENFTNFDTLPSTNVNWGNSENAHFADDGARTQNYR